MSRFTSLAILLGIVICVSGCSSEVETPGADQPKAALQKAPAAEPATEQSTEGPATEAAAAAGPGPGVKPTSEARIDLTEAIRRYLGCKSGESTVVRLCGKDLKGQGGPPPGIILGLGAGFKRALVGPSGAVIVTGQAESETKLSFEEGTTVKLAGGDVFVWKDGNWTPQKSLDGEPGVEEPAERPATEKAEGAGLAETYEKVDPAELYIFFMGAFNRIEVDSDGNIVQINGKVKTLDVANRPIELETDRIAHENGTAFILTRKYGKLKVTFTSNMQATFWLTPSQKKQLLALTK